MAKRKEGDLKDIIKEGVDLDVENVDAPLNSPPPERIEEDENLESKEARSIDIPLPESEKEDYFIETKFTKLRRRFEDVNKRIDNVDQEIEEIRTKKEEALAKKEEDQVKKEEDAEGIFLAQKKKLLKSETKIAEGITGESLTKNILEELNSEGEAEGRKYKVIRLEKGQTREDYRREADINRSKKEIRRDNYENAKEAILGRLPEKVREVFSDPETGDKKFKQYLRDHQQVEGFNDDTYFRLIADGIMVDQAKKESTTQKTVRIAKDLTVSIGGGVSLGLVGGLLLSNPIGLSLLGATTGLAGWGILSSVRFPKGLGTKVEVPLLDGGTMSFDSEEEFQDWVEEQKNKTKEVIKEESQKRADSKTKDEEGKHKTKSEMEGEVKGSLRDSSTVELFKRYSLDKGFDASKKGDDFKEEVDQFEEWERDQLESFKEFLEEESSVKDEDFYAMINNGYFMKKSGRNMKVSLNGKTFTNYNYEDFRDLVSGVKSKKERDVDHETIERIKMKDKWELIDNTKEKCREDLVEKAANIINDQGRVVAKKEGGETASPEESFKEQGLENILEIGSLHELYETLLSAKEIPMGNKGKQNTQELVDQMKIIAKEAVDSGKVPTRGGKIMKSITNTKGIRDKFHALISEESTLKGSGGKNEKKEVDENDIDTPLVPPLPEKREGENKEKPATENVVSNSEGEKVERGDLKKKLIEILEIESTMTGKEAVELLREIYDQDVKNGDKEGGDHMEAVKKKLEEFFEENKEAVGFAFTPSLLNNKFGQRRLEVVIQKILGQEEKSESKPLDTSKPKPADANQEKPLKGKETDNTSDSLTLDEIKEAIKSGEPIQVKIENREGEIEEGWSIIDVRSKNDVRLWREGSIIEHYNLRKLRKINEGVVDDASAETENKAKEEAGKKVFEGLRGDSYKASEKQEYDGLKVGQKVEVVNKERRNPDDQYATVLEDEITGAKNIEIVGFTEDGLILLQLDGDKITTIGNNFFGDFFKLKESESKGEQESFKGAQEEKKETEKGLKEKIAEVKSLDELKEVLLKEDSISIAEASGVANLKAENLVNAIQILEKWVNDKSQVPSVDSGSMKRIPEDHGIRDKIHELLKQKVDSSTNKTGLEESEDNKSNEQKEPEKRERSMVEVLALPELSTAKEIVDHIEDVYSEAENSDKEGNEHIAKVKREFEELFKKNSTFDFRVSMFGSNFRRKSLEGTIQDILDKENKTKLPEPETEKPAEPTTQEQEKPEEKIEERVTEIPYLSLDNIKESLDDGHFISVRKKTKKGLEEGWKIVSLVDRDHVLIEKEGMRLNYDLKRLRKENRPENKKE